MGERLLDHISVILLDVNSTFMFGEDRFGNDEDFYGTYRDLGGSRLDPPTVDRAIRLTLKNMFLDYENPARFEDFASLLEQLRKVITAEPDEALRLEAVIAQHELGRVPPEFAACLRALSLTHRLGIVSNIWAKKDIWLREFARAGIAHVWTSIVFSSDHRYIKPSPKLFELAIAPFDAPIRDCIFVGDSLRADILPAKRLGMKTVWVNPNGIVDTRADYSIDSLLQLQELQR